MKRTSQIDRRSLLKASAVLLPIIGWGQRARATDWSERPFSFDALSEAAKERASQPYEKPTEVAGPLAELTYDLYRSIAFDPERARWAGTGSEFTLHAFHPGWLFSEPVLLYEVSGDQARLMTFSTEDFVYRNEAEAFAEQIDTLPGISGFRLHYPLNVAGVMDELITFQGASYFRALGRGNAYGLSARGLAINTASQDREEFPTFTEFYVVQPAPGERSATVFASLDSPSVAGAFRFVITPGQETSVDVLARLYFRSDVAQLGVAPLTSMFLFAENNRAEFDDYRPQVHDSDGLSVRRADGDRLWRTLTNPETLATSYFNETAPRGFGLHQRDRDFDSYEDAGAAYHLRPSVEVDMLGEWGEGAVRLVEIPSDLEINDNIVAYWVPKGDILAGDMREFNYRLRWGMLPPDVDADLAYVASTRTGVGGPSGVPQEGDARKFVIDFKGGTLPPRQVEDGKITANFTAVRGAVEDETLVAFYVPEADVWRVIADVTPENGAATELVAFLTSGDRKLTETWLYQWRSE